MFNAWQASLRYALLLLIYNLLGCIGVDEQFGKTWKAGAIQPIGGEISLPENAPSMSNTYYEASADSTSTTGEEHLGLDIVAPLGTPVIAPASGHVVKVFTEPFYGNNIVIDHGLDETGKLVHTQYKHLKTQLVNVGEIIERGQQIGTLGRTGVLAGGLLHLHFEVQLEGQFGRMIPVNPHNYWIDGFGKVTCFDDAALYSGSPFKITYPVGCKGN